MNFYLAIHVFIIKTAEGTAATSTGQEEQKEQGVISTLLYEAAVPPAHLPSLVK